MKAHYKYVCFADGEKVATVSKDAYGRWLICWHRRGDCRERIANVKAAKLWVGMILKGKTLTWEREVVF